MKKKNVWSRLLAWVLILAMVFSSQSMSVFADVIGVQNVPAEETESEQIQQTDEEESQDGEEEESELFMSEDSLNWSGMVRGEGVNVRETPDTEAENILGKAADGEDVSILALVTLENGDQWYRVIWEGQQAYIKAEFVEIPQEETGTETETEIETETEAEAAKTQFTYGDSRVLISASADESANLPQDAELRVDYLEPGSGAYQEAAAALTAQLGGSEEGTTFEYVLYDVYFLSASSGERIEPEDGKVKVEMTFLSAVQVEAEGKILSAEVVHLKKDGSAEVVTDFINIDENGTISSMGFTQDSFSTVGAMVEVGGGTVEYSSYRAGGASGTNLNNFLTDIDFAVEDADGSVTVYPYESYAVTLRFAEGEDRQFVFERNSKDPLTYTFPDDFVPVAGSQDITISVSGYEIPARFEVSGQNVNLYIDWGNVSNEAYNALEAAANVAFSFQLNMQISDTATGGVIEFGDQVRKDVVIGNPNDIAVEKTGTYSEADKKFSYTITVTAKGENNQVVIEDVITGTALTYDRDSLKVSSSLGRNKVDGTLTEESDGKGFTYTEEQMEDGEVLTLTYTASVTAEGGNNFFRCSSGLLFI